MMRKLLMEKMTSKERLAAAINGNEVDHIPFAPLLAYFWEALPRNIQDKGQLRFHKMLGSDPLWRGVACPVKEIKPAIDIIEKKYGEKTSINYITPVGTLQEVWIKSETGNTTFLIEHPLKTEEDYKIQQWIEEHTRFEYDFESVNEHFSGEGKEGLSVGMLIPRIKSAFQALVEHYVGTEELVYAIYDYPETVEALWHTMVRNNLKAVKMAAESQYEYFLTWEDSSTQNYSPAQYNKYIKQEISQWCDILSTHNKRYIQHACGHVKDLIIPMKESGVYAVESISPPPTGNISIKDARKNVGPKFGIIGGIEPTEFLNLSPKQLIPYVKTVIENGRGGPFILANSDSCPPGVSIEKFKIVADIARRTTS